MTAPVKVPAYVHRYLVTGSDNPSVPVGTRLVDKGRELVKDWTFLNTDTGKFTTFVGARGLRCCSECYVHHRLVRDHGHAGEHGENAPYTPDPA